MAGKLEPALCLGSNRQLDLALRAQSCLAKYLALFVTKYR